MSTVITLPGGVYFENAEIGLERADQEFRSDYTGKRQVVAWPYALWVFTAQTIPYDHAEAGKLRSFLARLKGRVNLWRQPIPGAYNTAGYTGTNGTVSGSHVAGQTTLTIQGVTPNVLILRDGDYFTVNDELKIATADVYSGPTAQALVTFEPSLKRAAPNGVPVELKAPYVLLSAAKPDIARWKLAYPTRHTFNFVGTEAFE